MLQDPGLAFHPPTLYLGYVGLSVAFSLAVGALLTGEVDSRLARAMRPWVLGAWVLLTLGITAGSYWAYYELGWGGYWFWDPVENASLMPWLAATALLHSINVLAARGALKAWTMMLAVIAFSMSMVGTFLVRSGILTSVHAFAIDPERGTFLLVLLAIYVGAAFTLFALRGATLKEGAPFELVSRESGLVINNLLLSVILGIVFLGTLYPLFVEAMSGEKFSVGAPYFNAVAGPLALILAVLVGIGPLLSWRRERRPVFGQLKIPALLGGGGAGVITIILRAGHLHPAAPRFGRCRVPGGREHLPVVGRNPLRAPLATWGMVVAHFGIAVALTGMAANAAFTSERLAVAKPGEILTVGPWQVQLQDVTPTAGKNWTAIEAELRASRGDGHDHPQSADALFLRPPTETNESAIETFWNGQLYTVVGESDDSGGWQLRLWWKPFVTLIWAGGALIALGGALALLGRVWRRRRAASRAEWRRSATYEPRPAPDPDHSARCGWSPGSLGGWSSPRTRPFRRRWSSGRCRRSTAARSCRQAGSEVGRPRHGEPRLLNIFASWCVPCVGEAPVLARASKPRREDRRHRGPRHARRRSAPSSRSTAIRMSASAPTARARCKSRSDRRAFRKPSWSMASGVIRRQYIGPLTRANIPGVMRELEQLR